MVRWTINFIRVIKAIGVTVASEVIRYAQSVGTLVLGQRALDQLGVRTAVEFVRFIETIRSAVTNYSTRNAFSIGALELEFVAGTEWWKVISAVEFVGGVVTIVCTVTYQEGGNAFAIVTAMFVVGTVARRSKNTTVHFIKTVGAIWTPVASKR